jgi:hypothetical protein
MSFATFEMALYFNVAWNSLKVRRQNQMQIELRDMWARLGAQTASSSLATRRLLPRDRRLLSTLNVLEEKCLIILVYGSLGKWQGIRIYLVRSGTGSESSEITRVVDPDPDPYWESGSGSRGKKMKTFQWKNAHFSHLKKITTKKV